MHECSFGGRLAFLHSSNPDDAVRIGALFRRHAVPPHRFFVVLRNAVHGEFLIKHQAVSETNIGNVTAIKNSLILPE